MAHLHVLADFRDRLAHGDRADRLLDLALARLKEAGLVHEPGTQRTDSTHVLAAVRDLTGLELITELITGAVRAVLEEFAGAAPQLLAGLVDEHWGRRYGRPVRPGKNPTRPKTRLTNVGEYASHLLEHLHVDGGQVLRSVTVSRASGRSLYRTTTATRRAACAGPAATGSC